MFNTAVTVLALIGTSLVQAHPAANNPDPRPFVPLDCHRGVASRIDFIDKHLTLTDRLCGIFANNIRFINCEFHGNPQQILQIIGPNIMLYNNTFNDELLNITFFGENVILENNSFNGDNQLHKILGDQVSLTGNSYHGKQTHNITAEILNKISNKYVGSSQSHHVKARVLYEIENHHLGEQNHTLDANMITRVNNTHFGSPQIHNSKGNIFYRTRNEFYGCHQQHNSSVVLLLDYFNRFIGNQVDMTEPMNSQKAVSAIQVTNVPLQICADLTPLGLSSRAYQISKIRNFSI